MARMKADKIMWSLISTAAFLAVVVINGLANSLPLNDLTTGEISDSIPNLFVPAGITFAVWGVIYLMLFLFVGNLITALIRRDEATAETAVSIGPLFLISSAANIAWIFSWHWEQFTLSLLPMGILFVSLLLLYRKVKQRDTDSSRYRWLVRVPISIYLGWITVAVIANITAALVSSGWGGFGLPEQFWTVFVIVAAVAVNALMLIRERDWQFTLVGIWALIGIVIKRFSVSGDPIVSVIITAALGILILSAGVVFSLIRRRTSEDY